MYEHFNLDPRFWGDRTYYNNQADAAYIKAYNGQFNLTTNDLGGWGIFECSYAIPSICEVPASTWTCRPPPSPRPPPPRPPSPPSPSFESCEQHVMKVGGGQLYACAWAVAPVMQQGRCRP